MHKLVFGVAFILSFLFSFGQQKTDVIHYRFELGLTDASDTVKGRTTIKFIVKDTSSVFEFDLVGRGSSGKGMEVINVTMGDKATTFFQDAQKFRFNSNYPAKKGDTVIATIHYKGIPSDGLIISKNKFGERTFFADNWPNRAHHWIPCKDHPVDKAGFEFIVTAPSHYQVVSNGIKLEEKVLSGGITRTHWKEDVPLSTKIMVIGVAKFAVKYYSDSPAEIPVSAWVYPKDSIKGFYDYAVAPEILKFFIDYLGPYPYKKLANVQSTTIFGGMENAGCIFYSEKGVTGKRTSEDVVVHEIAHQWFGDMASEKDFSHLWLSEGFATYLTNIYYEHRYGQKAFHERLDSEKAQVIAFTKRSDKAVVDSTTPYMELLNENSYQKGGWFLHMLRQETGDSVFKKILQTYYQLYKGSNADTRDFQEVAENVSGKDLQGFFDQWLYQPGVPQLDIRWKADGKKLKMDIIKKGDYDLPLEVEITLADGKRIIQKFRIIDKVTEIKIELEARPVKLVIDPANKLLWEGKQPPRS